MEINFNGSNSEVSKLYKDALCMLERLGWLFAIQNVISAKNIWSLFHAFLTIIWADTVESHNDLVTSFQSTYSSMCVVLGDKWDWLFMTAYLLSPGDMKCWIIDRVLSTLRDQVLHPRDIYSTELASMLQQFCGFSFGFYRRPLVFSKRLVLNIFQLLSGFLLQFCRKMISYSNWKGHEDLFRHRFKKCKCQKRSWRKQM